LTASALAAEVIATLQIPPSFTVEVSAALDTVLVHRMPFEQVLHNLLGNAIKHHDRAAGHILIDVTEAGGRFHRFFVEDDGPGIPEAYRETVFEMFSTLKPRDEVEGSGMGLALVRKLVTRLGGTCGIQDIRGRGTRMWFDWPRA
jgi:signal transduction histidine kinase